MLHGIGGRLHYLATILGRIGRLQAGRGSGFNVVADLADGRRHLLRGGGNLVDPCRLRVRITGGLRGRGGHLRRIPTEHLGALRQRTNHRAEGMDCGIERVAQLAELILRLNLDGFGKILIRDAVQHGRSLGQRRRNQLGQQRCCCKTESENHQRADQNHDLRCAGHGDSMIGRPLGTVVVVDDHRVASPVGSLVGIATIGEGQLDGGIFLAAINTVNDLIDYSVVTLHKPAKVVELVLFFLRGRILCDELRKTIVQQLARAGHLFLVALTTRSIIAQHVSQHVATNGGMLAMHAIHGSNARQPLVVQFQRGIADAGQHERGQNGNKYRKKASNTEGKNELTPDAHIPEHLH